MTFKRAVGSLVFAGAIVGGCLIVKPACPPDQTPRDSVRRAVSTPAHAGSVDEVRQPGRRAAVFAIRRNLFAYAQLAEQHVTPRKTEPAATIRPAVVTPQVVRSEPEFLFKYIGRFGTDANPIAVFAGDGNVVNARIGDFVSGEFRLSGIGIESVEVTSGSGSVRRISLQP